MDVGPLYQVFQTVLLLSSQLGQLGIWLLQLFGLPTNIEIAGHYLNLGGIIASFLVGAGIFAMMSFLAKYSKLILYIGVIVLILTIISTFI